jgi:LmbE family N-acetylglucosaminyl deacetylase
MRSCNPRQRWIILSPHLDDGVLSCGGLIAAQASNVEAEIWTLFCGAPMWGPYSPIAQWLHGISGGATGSRLARLRRREDQAACRILGAGSHHFSWQDVAYRKGPDGSFLYSDSRQKTWREEDEAMISKMTSTLRQELSPKDVLLVPLAVGGHVDHIITRRAAELCGHTPLAFYPEVPYVQLYPNEVEKQTDGLDCVRYTVSREQISAWIAGVECYASQRRMLEEAAGPLPKLIRSFAETDVLGLYRDDRASSKDLAKLRSGAVNIP